jgi:hypothetical protein
MKSSKSIIKEGLAFKDKEKVDELFKKSITNEENSKTNVIPIPTKYSKETDVNFFKEKVKI